MSKRYAPPVRNFGDFWGRAGLPKEMKLEAEIAWCAALDALCVAAAGRLPITTPEQLRAIAKEMEGEQPK